MRLHDLESQLHDCVASTALQSTCLVDSLYGFAVVRIAVVVDHNAERPRVVDLVQGDLLARHLGVDAVQALQPTLRPIT